MRGLLSPLRSTIIYFGRFCLCRCSVNLIGFNLYSFNLYSFDLYPFRILQADVPNEITVRAGQQLKIAVPYSGGHPPPTAKWCNNDTPVDEKRAVIEVSNEIVM